MNSSLNLDTFLFHLKLFTTSFWNITHPYKSFASNYMRYDDSMFLLKFFIYLLFAFEYLCIVWHISPLTHFSTIINISLFVNNSNFFPVFFKQACQASPGADKNEQLFCFIIHHNFYVIAFSTHSKNFIRIFRRYETNYHY